MNRGIQCWLWLVLAFAAFATIGALADPPMTPFPSPMGTISGGGGGVAGSGAANEVAFWDTAGSITGDPDFTFDPLVAFEVFGCIVDTAGNLDCPGTISGSELTPSTPASSSPTVAVTTLLTTDNRYASGAAAPMFYSTTTGFPVVAFQLSSNGDIVVVRCGNATCTSGNTTAVVASLGGASSNVSMVIGSDNRPTIVYNNAGNYRLVKCGNEFCTSGNTDNLVFASGFSDTTALALMTDNTALVSGADINSLLLFVSKCSNAACSAVTSTGYSVGSLGQHASIVVKPDGLPSVSYYENFSATLKLLTCSNVSCTAATVTTVDPTVGAGHRNQIINGQNGFPQIVYMDAAFAYIRVAACNDLTCTAPSIVSVCTGGTCAFPSAVTQGSGNTVIFYYSSGGTNDLNSITCLNTACSLNTAAVVFSTGDTGQGSYAMLQPNGLPFVSWAQPSNELRVRVCADPGCAAASGSVTTGGAPLGSTSDRFTDLYIFKDAYIHLGDTLATEATIGYTSSALVVNVNGIPSINMSGTTTVFNSAQQNLDFRAATVANANGIFLDASAETIDLVGGSGSTGCSISSTGSITCTGKILTNGTGGAVTGTCGGTAVSVNDTRGIINSSCVGSGTIIYTFNSAYATRPACVVSGQDAAAAFWTVLTTTTTLTMTFTGATFVGDVYYICVG